MSRVRISISSWRLAPGTGQKGAHHTSLNRVSGFFVLMAKFRVADGATGATVRNTNEGAGPVDLAADFQLPNNACVEANKIDLCYSLILVL